MCLKIFKCILVSYFHNKCWFHSMREKRITKEHVEESSGDVCPSLQGPVRELGGGGEGSFTGSWRASEREHLSLQELC